MSTSQTLPWFLQSFENLTTHFEEHFSDLNGNDRGERFVQFACKLMSLVAEGQDFTAIRVADKKTHDGGVDILSDENERGFTLRLQSKYKIRGKEDVDTILSKFENYERQMNKGAVRPLIPDDAESPTTLLFGILTTSKLDKIRDSYVASAFASRPFYDRLTRESRLFVIDGPRIFQELQSLYRKAHIVPNTIELDSLSGWLQQGNVRMGIVSGAQLVDLYRSHGDAIFFENIRDFLGVTSGKKHVETRETVNSAIIATISTAPERLLERNNGVTFRAAKICPLNETKVRLDAAGIINGCQTTMCLVESASRAAECAVAVKVVETSDAWEIAKASNFQNAVAQIDLDLARFFRPQIVTKAATDLGYGLTKESESDIAGILNRIYESVVGYDEMKCAYLGLFSRKPNNIFEGNYTELRVDVLQRLYAADKDGDQVFTALFMLLKESRNHLAYCESTFTDESYTNLLKRFFNDDKPRYRSLMAILAVCGFIGDDISERSSDPEIETERMRSFVVKVREGLQRSPGDFKKCFVLAFQVLSEIVLEASAQGSPREIQQLTYSKISGMPFNILFAKLKMRMDASVALDKI